MDKQNFETEQRNEIKETYSENIKKKFKTSALIIPIAIVAVIFSVIILYANTPGQKIKRQIMLGDKYLSELDYDNAVAAYKMALDIDPNRSDVGIMLGDTYVKQGNARLSNKDRVNAYESFVNAKNYGVIEEAEYGMVSCTLMEADELFSQGERESTIRRLIEIEMLYADARILMTSGRNKILQGVLGGV